MNRIKQGYLALVASLTSLHPTRRLDIGKNAAKPAPSVARSDDTEMEEY